MLSESEIVEKVETFIEKEFGMIIGLEVSPYYKRISMTGEKEKCELNEFVVAVKFVVR